MDDRTKLLIAINNIQTGQVGIGKSLEEMNVRVKDMHSQLFDPERGISVRMDRVERSGGLGRKIGWWVFVTVGGIVIASIMGALIKLLIFASTLKAPTP